MAVGANAVWVAAAMGKVDSSILYLLPVACIAALLPDIAAAGGAKVHYAAGGILGVFKGAFYGKYFHHRGLMHSVFVVVLLYLILLVLFHNSYPLLPVVAAVAYASHPFIDGLNTTVGYWYPFSRKRMALVPRALQTRVNGPIDQLLLVLGLFGLALFFLLHLSQFIPA